MLGVMLLLWMGLARTCAQVPTYPVTNSGGLGRPFDGIGGLSGGGATSKLLVSYPKQQRDEILDFLFKPKFGASLQILKVEIGGDDQSSDGSEASHMHEPWDLNYQRGYEWWLMKEAKKRNPAIRLYGLAWSWPGWVFRKNSPYSFPEVTAKYILNWIRGAKNVHNLTIDYIGIWNERPTDFNYLLTLRKVLNDNGFQNVQIVAPDGWSSSKGFYSFYNNKTVWRALDIFGVHYPGTMGIPGWEKTGKRLWSSEDFSSFNDDVGAGCWARIINRNYVNAFMTSTIAWNLIASYYKDLPWYRDGLMDAMQPWSGHFQLRNPIWVSAHTTQFTEIGWIYLGHGSGVGNLTAGGTFVSFTDPTRKQLTIVIETMTHNHSLCIRPALYPYNVSRQKAVFKLGGSFSSLTKLYHWKTELKFDGSPTTAFQQLPSLKVVGGRIALDLDVDAIHTLTTVPGLRGQQGSNPPFAAFPLPYKDNFDSYKLFEEPRYLSPQSGAWEVHSDSKRGKIARQTVLNKPGPWCSQEAGNNALPMAIIGNSSWTDVIGSVDVRLPLINGSESVFLGVRSLYPNCNPAAAAGVFLHLLPPQTFALTADAKGKKKIFGGTLSSKIKKDNWYKMSVSVEKQFALGYLNGKKLFNVSLPGSTRKNGFVSLGSQTYGLVDFDNLEIK